MTTGIDWAKIHPILHKKYTGERSPRSECPLCKELYFKKKAEKAKELKPANAEVPKAPVKPRKIATPEPVGGIYRFKGLTVGRKSLSPEDLSKIFKHAVKDCKIPDRVVHEILSSKKDLLEHVIGTLKKVYEGLGDRLLAEITIVIIAYVEYFSSVEQETPRHSSGRRKKQK